MTIGELARATGCGIETIRYYEHEGLLPKPGRTSGNFRRYGQEHAELLSFIRRCRSLDMALNEIRILLRFRSAPEKNCGEVNALLETHIGHVEERIAELRNLEGQLRALREKCSSERSGKHCGILQGLGDIRDDRGASGNKHIPCTHSTKR
ncbi:MAG: Cd(II)/Pb(II)-responsive transcriptional regulator [Bryobacterales bacterium]|nr:Cd(II)/Pb(II)-responsive transcriptional regulator [Bryobacterales bacterium]